MMNALILCLILLVASTTANVNLVKKSQSFNAVGKEVLEFLEGTLIGLEAEVGNLTECTKDLDITLDDFDVSFALISRGFRHLSVRDVEQGIIEMGSGVDQVAKSFQPCGLPHLSEDVEKLAKQLQAGVLGIVKVVAEETLNVFSHEHAITGYFHGAVDNWKAKNFKFAGLNVGKILGILLNDNY